MNREQKINRVLAGLSHTGYTTEIEKCEARLLIEELTKENEKLNHYKLLYQKVKERNDKAIERLIIKQNSRNIIASVSDVIRILKGNEE